MQVSGLNTVVVGTLSDLACIDAVLKDVEKEQEVHRWISNGNVTRKTIDYGWSYPDLEKKIKKYNTIPPSVEAIRAKVYALFAGFLSDPKTPPEKFDNVIISIYGPEELIKPHIDREYFGEDIMGIVLRADKTASLYFSHQKDPTKAVATLQETVGSCYLMKGQVRHAYLHGVSPVSEKRITMTFRTLKKS